MEFPFLGDHCQKVDCKKLDFLPFKCNACDLIFCKDHFLFEQHQCKKASSFQQDHQVPICPLCNKPVSFKHGDLPDVNMNRHIEQDCLVKSNSKIYKNKCSMANCSKREMIELICPICKLNYCFKHRHAIDHQCTKQNSNSQNVNSLNRQTRASNSAGNLSMKSRLVNNSTNYIQKIGNLITSTSSATNSTNNLTASSSRNNLTRSNQNLRSLQGDNLNDDEALAMAIQQSINQHPSTGNQSKRNVETVILDDEDEDLNRAIELSKREYEKNKEKCVLS